MRTIAIAALVALVLFLAVAIGFRLAGITVGAGNEPEEPRITSAIASAADETQLSKPEPATREVASTPTFWSSGGESSKSEIETDASRLRRLEHVLSRFVDGVDRHSYWLANELLVSAIHAILDSQGRWEQVKPQREVEFDPKAGRSSVLTQSSSDGRFVWIIGDHRYKFFPREFPEFAECSSVTSREVTGDLSDSFPLPTMPDRLSWLVEDRANQAIAILRRATSAPK